ncbi:MAG: hypothetical protein DRP18_04825, partial [Candidatus Aenigmatarchaeota archaeon]
MKPKTQWDTSKRAKELRLLYPFGDKDKDGVPNIFDCQPFNPLEQGFFDWVSKGVSVVKKTFTPVVQPVVQKVTPVFEEVRTKVTAIKPVIKKYAEAASKPSSLSGLYIHEIRKHKEVKPKAEKSILSGYETVFVPARTHFKMVSKMMEKPERAYETKVIEPVTTTILGEREKALREQTQKVESSYKEVEKLHEEVKKHEKPEWKRTKEGAVVLPTEPAPEVKTWKQRWKPYIKGGRFTGTEAQYQEYMKGFRKYYKEAEPNRFVLREQYLRLTPEAQTYEQVIKRYEQAAERYKKESEKYKSMPQPNLLRQTTAGIAAGALYLPIWRLSVGRVATGAIAEPRAFPSKAVSYVKGIIGLAKERPGYFAGSLIGMGIVGAGAPRLKPYAERLSPLYVSPKRITATPVLEEKMPSTGRVPVSTSPETLKGLMEEPTFKPTGKPEEVWHATPGRFEMQKGGITYVKEGYSATKGLYVGPAAYPKFAVGSIIEAPRRMRTPTEPTLYSIITRGIEIPKEAKVTKGEIIAAKRILGRRAVPGSDIIAFAKYKRYVEQ